MRFLLVLLVTLLPTETSAQVEVSVEHAMGEVNPITLVRLSGRPIALMCEGFVKEFGENPESGMISVKPKTFPSGQEEMTGEVWVVRNGNREVEIERSELPAPLNSFRGIVARRILRGTCYTKEFPLFSYGDLSFITSNFAEAQIIARTLRGQ